MSYRFFEVSHEGSVGVVRLNRPPINAFNLEMVREFNLLLDILAKTESMSSIVIAGNKKIFSA
ncbi:MAG TPA: enoyl-CoA hydratase-related protein, partial [Thermodesulfobacteriota bacterium]